MPTMQTISYWKPSLTDADVAHLRALGFYGSQIKGNPSRRHLKKMGEPSALCGAKPGTSKGGNRMKDRTGWLIYEAFEAPGIRPCPDCMKLAEALPTSQGEGTS